MIQANGCMLHHLGTIGEGMEDHSEYGYAKIQCTQYDLHILCINGHCAW